MTPVRLEPVAPRSRVMYSTTEPLRSFFGILEFMSRIDSMLSSVEITLRPNLIVDMI